MAGGGGWGGFPPGGGGGGGGGAGGGAASGPAPGRGRERRHDLPPGASRPDRNRAQRVFRGKGGKGRQAGPAAGRPISPQAQEIARDSSKPPDGIRTVSGLRAPPAPALPVGNLSEVDR